ncbi:2-oxoacid:acceptor oxidoreductase family protein [bacterium]|nr:2-oxoacid:acceptor oxidoreductase family protein [candidate division CSSED10-310 bacterium]
MRYEIRLSGSGGQGMILAGVILAEAAAIYDEKNATQSQSYGPEARGGASKSDVIISDEDIDYPKATNIDLLLALTQEACDKYICDLRKKAILIADSFRVLKMPEGDFRVFHLPILKTADEVVGKAIVANIVALGAIVEITGIVSREAIESAVMARVPRGTEDLNRKALTAGINIVRQYMKDAPGDSPLAS